MTPETPWHRDKTISDSAKKIRPFLETRFCSVLLKIVNYQSVNASPIQFTAKTQQLRESIQLCSLYSLQT